MWASTRTVLGNFVCCCGRVAEDGDPYGVNFGFGFIGVGWAPETIYILFGLFGLEPDMGYNVFGIFLGQGWTPAPTLLFV